MASIHCETEEIICHGICLELKALQGLGNQVAIPRFDYSLLDALVIGCHGLLIHASKGLVELVKTAQRFYISVTLELVQLNVTLKKKFALMYSGS